MNRDRLYLGFVTALIVTVVIYTSYGLLNSEKKDTHYVVSVIVSNSGSDRWNAFKEGLNQGANESGIYLNIVSASTFSGLADRKTASCSLIPIWIWRGDTRSCSRMPGRSEKPSPR